MSTKTNHSDDCFECSGCGNECNVEQMVPHCDHCVSNNIITHMLWNELGIPKFKTPLHFAVEFNNIVDSINEHLKSLDIQQTTKKINIKQVESLESTTADELFKSIKDLYV